MENRSLGRPGSFGRLNLSALDSVKGSEIPAERMLQAKGCDGNCGSCGKCEAAKKAALELKELPQIDLGALERTVPANQNISAPAAGSGEGRTMDWLVQADIRRSREDESGVRNELRENPATASISQGQKPDGRPEAGIRNNINAGAGLNYNYYNASPSPPPPEPRSFHHQESAATPKSQTSDQSGFQNVVWLVRPAHRSVWYAPIQGKPAECQGTAAAISTTAMLRSAVKAEGSPRNDEEHDDAKIPETIPFQSQVNAPETGQKHKNHLSGKVVEKNKGTGGKGCKISGGKDRFPAPESLRFGPLLFPKDVAITNDEETNDSPPKGGGGMEIKLRGREPKVGKDSARPKPDIKSPKTSRNRIGNAAEKARECGTGTADRKSGRKRKSAKSLAEATVCKPKTIRTVISSQAGPEKHRKIVHLLSILDALARKKKRSRGYPHWNGRSQPAH
jgi:hypothetical protein